MKMEMKLTERATILLELSVEEYRLADPNKQRQYREHIQEMLDNHKTVLNAIGSGFDNDYVEAGKRFLKLIENGVI